MRTAAKDSRAAASESVGLAVGEIASELRRETAAGESPAAAPGATGRRIPRPKRRTSWCSESWLGKKSSSHRSGTRADRSAGTQDAFLQVRTADARSVGRQAGLTAERGYVACNMF